MHARAIANYLRKRCLANLKSEGALSTGSTALVDAWSANTPYIEVTHVADVVLDPVGYLFTIRRMALHPHARPFDRLEVRWALRVHVDRATKDVYVEDYVGRAPKHVVNCLEGSYSDLRLDRD